MKATRDFTKGELALIQLSTAEEKIFIRSRIEDLTRQIDEAIRDRECLITASNLLRDSIDEVDIESAIEDLTKARRIVQGLTSQNR